MSEMIGIIRQAKTLLRDHEGLRLEPYQCTGGKKTIGYGHNLDDNGVPRLVELALEAQGSITEQIAEQVLDEDVWSTIKEIENFSYWEFTPGTVRAALIDMYFCLGMDRYSKFKKMNAALANRDYEEAAAQILDSKFAHQTGRRALELAAIVRMG